MSKTTSLVISDEIDAALDEMAAESVRRQDAEQLSRSEIIRKMIRDGIDQRDVSDLLSEERRILLMRERMIEERNQVTNLRTQFETRVKRHFVNRFENGIKLDGLDKFAENMIREVHLLWPEWSESDYSERREEAIAYVEDVRDETQRAIEQSDYDPLDPASIFDAYEGVERGGSRDNVDFGRLVSEAAEALGPSSSSQQGGKTLLPSKMVGPDPDAIATSLSNTYDVPLSLAEEAVEAAEEDADQGVPADD